MRTTEILVIVLGVFLGTVEQASAAMDSIFWKSHTTNEGLPNNYIKAIYEDSKGYLWIGTQYGLSKYDGYEFEIFESNLADSLSLSSNNITALFEDSKERLWVGTSSGLNRFLDSGLGFEQFYHRPNDFSSLINNNIVRIFEDEQGELWVATSDGSLHMFEQEKESFLRFSPQVGNDLRDVAIDAQGRFILGFRQGGGVVYFDSHEGLILSHEISELTKDLNVYSLLLDRDGILWVGTSSGFYSYEEGSGLLITHRLPSSNAIFGEELKVFDLNESEEGHIWIGTDGDGIFIYDKTKNEFSWIDTFKNGINSLAITQLFFDSHGVSWVGTVNSGIGREMKYESIVDHFTYQGGSSQGLSGKVVSSFHESSAGGLWIGMDQGGVNYFDRKSQEFTHYLNNPRDPSSLSDNIVNSVYEDSRGDLYVGTYLKGFDVKREGRTNFQNFWSTGGESTVSSTFVRAFLEDSFGNFWIGTVTTGLVKFDRNTKQATTFGQEFSSAASPEIDHVTYLMEDSHSNLWVGTIRGLFKMDVRTGEYKRYIQVSGDDNSIDGNFIMCIYEDDQGRVWVGTDHGLNRYHRDTDNFSFVGLRDGLPGSWVKIILQGEGDELWIGTNRGICRFDMSDESIEMLNISEQIKIQAYSWGGLKSQDGKLWFGTVDGIFSFYPGSIKKNPIVPPVHITSLLIKNQPVEPGKDNSPLQMPIIETQELVLDHIQAQVITLGYTGINFVHPDQNEYAYRLEGFENTWNYVGQQRQATYTNLEPGDYTFHVKASNNDGVWNEQGASLKIKVLPPWYKTWQAYLLLLLLIMMIGFAIWYSERLRLKLVHDLKIATIEREKEKELSQLKAQFFTNISHEFKTPLTLILGPLEQIIRSESGDDFMKKQLRMIHQNAHRLLGLVNQIMDFRKLEAGKLKLQATESDLVSFSQEILEAFQLKAQNSGIILKFHALESPLMVWFEKRKIDKVLFNLLSNAFRYSHHGDVIELSVKLADDDPEGFVEIEVKDTGIGIDPKNQELIFERFFQVSTSSLGTGIGLSLSKSLVELHHGTLRVESQPGKGSTFVVRLPLGVDHLSVHEIDVSGGIEDKESHLSYEALQSVDKTEQAKVVDVPTILLVEDDLELRAFIKQIVESHQYVVTLAKDGQEGLEKALRENPDLIITDVLMPNIDGFDFCKQLKSNFLTSHIPVIMLTSLSEEENSLRGFEAGADAYLFKPFNERLIISRIQNLLLSRKKLREHFQMKNTLEKNEVSITPADERFMEQVLEIIERNLENSEFNVEVLAKEMAMSRSVLFKKIKSFVGLAPNEFIQIVKLKRAEVMLLKGGEKISEVAYKLGFSNPKTFRSQFKKYYGQTPSEYIQEHH